MSSRLALPPARESREKVLRSLANTGFLNVWEGAVRSGKTVIALYAAARAFMESPETRFIMSGRTIKTIEQNAILNDFGILRMIPGSQYRKVGESRAVTFSTGGVKKEIIVYGAADIRAYMALRGISAGGWYADEVNLHDRAFVEEALRRTAVSTDRRHFWTLNPDNPRHWIYTEYLDRYAAMTADERRRLGGYHYWHFTPLDNPAMSAEMYEALRLQFPQGSYLYARYVEGRRVQAEGLIYPDITARYFVDMEAERDRIDIRYCAVDFGANHATVMLWGGFYGGNKADFRVYREYCDEKSGRTTYDYYGDFLAECQALGVDPRRVQIAIDPAALALRNEFLKHGLTPLRAKNDVLPGIEFVRSAVKNGHVLFNSASCRRLREELATYSWDEKAAALGVERPIKEHDDASDALRYLLYTFLRNIY